MSQGSPWRRRPVLKTMQPGQPGTLRLLQRYGEPLVCVRYREDTSGRKRYTTVELVVDEAPLTHRNDRRTLVAVHLPVAAHELRDRAIALGARWDAKEFIWWMPWHVAEALGLQSRAQTRRPKKKEHPPPR